MSTAEGHPVVAHKRLPFVGPMRFACSDIAAEGYQHVDGAVRMGARVAEQILER